MQVEGLTRHHAQSMTSTTTTSTLPPSLTAFLSSTLLPSLSTTPSASVPTSYVRYSCTNVLLLVILSLVPYCARSDSILASLGPAAIGANGTATLATLASATATVSTAAVGTASVLPATVSVPTIAPGGTLDLLNQLVLAYGGLIAANAAAALR